MRSRTFPIATGVLLCTHFSPLPIHVPDEPIGFTLVIDPTVTSFYKFDRGKINKESDIFGVKPLSWFINHDILLCSVQTVPYEHCKRHKHSWG